MNKELLKQVCADTEKSHEENKKEEVKQKIREIVEEYLTKIDVLDKKISDLQDERTQLKLTIDDLKLGKLSLIEDRLKVDKKAREVNVIEIHEINIHHNNPFYIPYEVTYPSVLNTRYCSGGGMLTCSSTSFTTTGADCKNYAIGSYTINGQPMHLR